MFIERCVQLGGSFIFYPGTRLMFGVAKQAGLEFILQGYRTDSALLHWICTARSSEKA